MEEFVDIQCPFCGQTCEVVIDTSLGNQRFTTDCEVCCRPFEVVAECKAGEVVSAEARSE
jgi:transposase-like protein